MRSREGFVILHISKRNSQKEREHEKNIVCAALDEQEADHKVKYLNENAVVCQTYSGYSVAYAWKAVSLETQPSWLINLKK